MEFDSVHKLIVQLGHTFLSPPATYYTSKAQQYHANKIKSRVLTYKAFDCLLFGYDDDTTCESIAECLTVAPGLDVFDGCSDVLEKFIKSVSQLKDTEEEISAKMLMLLMQLSHAVEPKYNGTLKYGFLAELAFPPSDILDEGDVFSIIPMLAPRTLQSYTFYPTCLFDAPTTLSLADSGFSDKKSCSSYNSFPICENSMFSQLPHLSSDYPQCDTNNQYREKQLSLCGALSNHNTSESLQDILELPSIDIAPVTLGRASSPKHSKSPRYESGEEPESPMVLSEVEMESKLFQSHKVSAEYPQPVSWELKRRRGGCIGCNVYEKPYLTEAGPEVFNNVYKMLLKCQYEIDTLSEPSKHDIRKLPIINYISMTDLLKDVSRLLVGVSSKCFDFDQTTHHFSVKQGLVVRGLSRQSLSSACQVFLDAGRFYYRLCRLTNQVHQSYGLTITAFFSSLSRYLNAYTAAVLDVCRKSRSLLHLSLLLKPHLQQIRLVAQMCYCDQVGLPEYLEALPTGVSLLSYLYELCEDYSSSDSYYLLLNIMYDTSQPYLMFLQDWLFNGHCTDPFEEFIILVEPHNLEAKDRKYWTDGYKIQRDAAKLCRFIGSVCEQVYTGGKSLSLLRRICPEHPIFVLSEGTPILDISLTENHLHDTTKNVSMYIERVDEMLKHMVYTRRMILEDKEEKRKELVRQAQADQAQRLTDIYKRMSLLQDAEDAKKRKLFKELKENMEDAAQRQAKEIEDEKRSDAQLIKDLTEREQLKVEADAALYQKAKEELEEYYRLLGETAAAREQRALWRIRRHQLDMERERFLTEQEELLKDKVERVASGLLLPDGAKVRWVRPASIKVKEDDEDCGDEQTTQSGNEFLQADENEGTSSDTVEEADNSRALVEDASENAVLTDVEVDGGITDGKSFSNQVKTAEVVVDGSVTELDKQFNGGTIYTASSTAADKNDSVSRQQLAKQQASLSTKGSLEAALKVADRDLPVSFLPHMLKRTTRAVDGRHASNTTFDKEFLVRACIRRFVPASSLSTGQKIQGEVAHDSKTSGQDKELPRRMMASTESDEVDRNLLRLEKFKKINTHGHASQSSIQKLLYYDSINNQSPSFEEKQFAPLQPASGDEDETFDYDTDCHLEYIKAPQHLWVPRGMPQSSADHIELYRSKPISALLQNSLSAVITGQTMLTNKAILSYFMVELEMDKHLDLLHSYLLMGKGEFSLTFTHMLFDKLHGEQERCGVTSTYFLTDALNRALQLVPLAGNQFTANLSISKSQIPQHILAYSLDAFTWLSLSYKVDWPMNIIITSEQLVKYGQIFTYLLMLKHVTYLLSDSWHSLKFSSLTHHSDICSSQHLRQIHLIRHDMQHFVKVLHNYVTMQITQVTWKLFQDELRTTVKSLDDLYESHNKFINRCLSRCFLSQKVLQIKKVLDAILKSIYKFHALLSMGQWLRDNETNAYVHTEYDNILKVYTPFKEYTSFMNKVLTKMTDFNKNQHLQELQLMLDYNQFYMKLQA